MPIRACVLSHVNACSGGRRAVQTRRHGTEKGRQEAAKNNTGRRRGEGGRGRQGVEGLGTAGKTVEATYGENICTTVDRRRRSWKGGW